MQQNIAFSEFENRHGIKHIHHIRGFSMTLEKQKSFEDNPIWKLKVRLQFSGWLQYIVHAILVLIMLVIAGIGWLDIGRFFCFGFHLQLQHS